jgi:hypothetical protein
MATDIISSLPELRGSAGGDSRIDPTLRPYLGLGLQRAEQLFFGPGPQFFPGQTYVSPSEQTLTALQQQEALARGSQPALQEAQRAFLAGLGPSAAAPLFQNLYGQGATQAGADIYGRAAAGQMGISPNQFQSLYGQAAPGTPTAVQQAAAGQMGISPSQFQDLYSRAGAGAPSLYGQVAGGQGLPTTAGLSQLAAATRPGVPSAISQAAAGQGGINTSFLSGLTQQAGQQPAAGLYSQVAGGGFRNLAMDPTMQTAAGSFLMGSPYQQALIDQSVRPIARQLGEVTLPGIQSAFSAAGRYGSGAQQRAIEGAVEAASRAAGDVATNIGFGTYGQERGFQEAARQQLAGLSQQDLANRLSAASALQSGQQSAIAQQAGLFGQQAGLQQQNLSTQLQAAQAQEAIRQSQLAQASGLQGQIFGAEQQNLAARLQAAGAGEATRQAQIAQQAGLAGQTTGIQAQNIATQLGAAQTAEQIRQAQLGQQAGLAGQIAGLSGQNISTQLAGASGLQSAQQAAFGRQMQAAGGLGAAQEAQLARGLTGAQLAPQIFAQQFLPSQQLGQIGAAREQIAALPLQEEMARFQFGQQVPYQQLQGFLSSVYGTPMATSNVPQAQVNRVGQGLGGAVLGGQVGSLFGRTMENPGGYGTYGAILGGLAGLL